MMYFDPKRRNLGYLNSRFVAQREHWVFALFCDFWLACGIVMKKLMVVGLRDRGEAKNRLQEDLLQAGGLRERRRNGE